jgi:hypothetical protein
MLLSKSGMKLQQNELKEAIDVANRGLRLLMEKSDWAYTKIRYQLTNNLVEGYLRVGDEYSMNEADVTIEKGLMKNGNNIDRGGRGNGLPNPVFGSARV